MKHLLLLMAVVTASTIVLSKQIKSEQKFLFGRPLEYEMIHSDSGIPRRPLQEIHQDFAKLADSHAESADWIEYGRSVRKNPLLALRIMNKKSTGTPQDASSRPAVFISEAIHGNEYLHITDRLPFELLADRRKSSAFSRFIDRGGVVYFVPVINPDGYSAGQRGNANGADLNRDFAIPAAGNDGFRQPETKAISDFLKSQTGSLKLTVEATMEYHCCIGGLIHPWAWTSEGLTGEALQRHQEFGEMVQEIFGYPYGTVSDILGYSAVGGSDDYYLETYGRRAFSFEGQRSQEARRLADHIRLWEQFFTKLNSDL